MGSQAGRDKEIGERKSQNYPNNVIEVTKLSRPYVQP